jgi:hypothetical protein
MIDPPKDHHTPDEATVRQIMDIIRVPGAIYPFSASELRDAIADALRARQVIGNVKG